MLDTEAVANLDTLAYYSSADKTGISLVDASYSGESSDFNELTQVVALVDMTNLHAMLSKISSPKLLPQNIPEIYWDAFAYPTDENKAHRSKAVQEIGVDGFMIIVHKYRLRGVPGLTGDDSTKWVGEIESYMKIYDASGKAVFDYEWVSTSPDFKIGESLGSEQMFDLLESAAIQSRAETSDLVSNLKANQEIPDNIRSIAKVEQEQESAKTNAEAAAFGRGFVVLALITSVIIGGIWINGINENSGLRNKSIIVVLGLAALTIYVTFFLGWWRDGLITAGEMILELISEFIFG